MKAFQAYGNAGRVTSEKSARDAGEMYFAKFPKSRKCDIIAGTTDGYFFTVAYGRASTGEWPESHKNVTKKTLVGI